VVCPHFLDEIRRGLASEYFRHRVGEARADDIVSAISEAAICSSIRD